MLTHIHTINPSLIPRSVLGMDLLDCKFNSVHMPLPAFEPYAALYLIFSKATLLTFIGPKAAKNLRNDDFYAVLTVGIFVIGNAVCNIPSSPIFHRYGRMGGFFIGTLHLLLGGALGAIAVATESLGLLLFASFVIGFGVGLGQFYRFAAIELASAQNKGAHHLAILLRTDSILKLNC